jgi:protein arginine kinase activator
MAQCACGSHAVLQITELKEGKADNVVHMCLKCGHEYMQKIYRCEDMSVKKNKLIDLTSITTPEQLLQFMSQISQSRSDKTPCDKCGLTTQEFQTSGKFGCPNCYDHFKSEFEALVVPFHGANEHLGKKPNRRKPISITEQLKTLRLYLAKSVEVEDYESAAYFKREIERLTSPLP